VALEIPDGLAEAVRGASSIAVLTGAGISAESGVPTFRDAQTGLWQSYRPEDLATPEAFDRDPELVWRWYAWRRELISGVEPNEGHRALAELERLVPRFTLATQNVDGLHRRAGSRNVLELHGDISRTICSRERVAVDPQGLVGEPPVCPGCGAYLRPDVVWFGEALPVEAFETAQEEARESYLFLSVGTSSLVQPAASLPQAALSVGATVVEVNPEPTPLTSQADYALRGPAGDVLPALLGAYGDT
jgi:NAD-dependent deacetylase